MLSRTKDQTQYQEALLSEFLYFQKFLNFVNIEIYYHNDISDAMEKIIFDKKF